MTAPTSEPAPNAGGRAPSALITDMQRTLGEIAAQLQAPAPMPGLQLTQRDCQRLEETTGLGSTRSAEEFLRAVDRLAALRIGDVRLAFTPGQLAEFQHRAMKRGRTVEQELRAVVARIEEELFYKGG